MIDIKLVNNPLYFNVKADFDNYVIKYSGRTFRNSRMFYDFTQSEFAFLNFMRVVYRRFVGSDKVFDLDKVLNYFYGDICSVTALKSRISDSMNAAVPKYICVYKPFLLYEFLKGVTLFFGTNFSTVTFDNFYFSFLKLKSDLF